MKALVDADVLLYEIGFACEYGKEEIPSFEYVKEVFHARLQSILDTVEATDYTLYLTGKDNFRIDIAKRKPYKGNREDKKPFHYHNLKAYILATQPSVLVEGMEADDAMAIEQTRYLERSKQTMYDMEVDGIIERHYDGKNDYLEVHSSSIICTRDKDLRMVEGLHYGWESGKQGEYGPKFVDEIGSLSKVIKRKTVKGEEQDVWDDTKGEGIKFFYFQLLTGDGVDNIPGCPGVGHKGAYNLLCDLTEEKEMYRVVFQQYCDKYAENPFEELLEQAHLLWMVREVDEDDKPVMWTPPI